MDTALTDTSCHDCEQTTQQPGDHKEYPATVELEKHILPSVDFLYLTGHDWSALNVFAARVYARTNRDDFCTTQDYIGEAYLRYCHYQKETLNNALSEREALVISFGAEIHRMLTEQSSAISTTNVTVAICNAHADFSLQTHRVFSSDGERLLFHGSSECSDIDNSIKDLAERLRSKGISKIFLIDDHMVSGGTIAKIIAAFLQNKIETSGVLVGSNFGEDAVCVGSYVVPITCLVKVPRRMDADMVEFSEFIPGIGGAILSSKNGMHHYRMPYVLPFCSPVKRASIDRSKALVFSLDSLRNARSFFADIAESLNVPILLRDLDPLFVSYVFSSRGIRSDTRMDLVLSSVIEDLVSCGTVANSALVSGESE